MSDKCALAFGEVLWDVYPEKKTLGGAALNFAAHFALKGGSARLISAVGDDTLGQQALCEIQRLSVDTRFVSVLPGQKTGRCDVTLDGNAVPQYDLIPDTAYDRIPAEGVDDTRCDVFYFGTLALREGRNTASLRQLLARVKMPTLQKSVLRSCPRFCARWICPASPIPHRGQRPPFLPLPAALITSALSCLPAEPKARQCLIAKPPACSAAMQ